MALEYLLPARRDVADESLESFVVRRFGREAFDRLIQPLIGGIYTADPAKLSMAATMPQFVEMERKWGSVVRGVRAKSGQEPGARCQEPASGARYGQFLAPKEGMGRLVAAIVARLPEGCVRLNAAVSKIERADMGWRVTVSDAGAELFDELVLAAPGAVSSRLLETVDKPLADLIGRIPCAGCSVVLVGARREQIRHPLDGFGFVVPVIDGRKIIACSLASVKFAGRAPEGKVLLRVFMGGALQPELNQLADDEIKQLVLVELGELIGLSGEPDFCDVARWPGMMPQYHVGHLDVVRQIEERVARIGHFALAGNAYRGVGIPFCIHSGEQAAERVMRSAECGVRNVE
jgi:oxygen-dependent protoporphyrinogen oxidase